MMTTIQTPNSFIYFNDEAYLYLSKIAVKNAYSKIFILVDTHTHRFCISHFLGNLVTEIELEIIEIDSGEENKNIETCLQLWETLTELGGDRKSLLINLGGGVITDIGGFIACTFKRGIDFIHVPTTLLGMVDAAIGGKNGVDLDHLKNQIGVIREPLAVLVDTTFLETLPQNHMRSGFAEILKHGLIFDKCYWNSLNHLSSLNWKDLEYIIHRSVEIKNTIVSADLTENGIRKILNFGHTIGHAIESYCLHNNIEILHGDAVAAGIVMESYISWKLNLLDKNTYNEIKSYILSIFGKLEIKTLHINSIIDLMVYDKKNEFGKIQFVLLNDIGNAVFNKHVNHLILQEALQDYF